ncbi:acyltransferase [Agrobacterium vitis]|uniref:acyltransferase family protein n=1 Tax=Agrobacterium vitis TaxID=373 RepID=UPI00307DBE97
MKIDQELSARIHMARLMLIVGIVFVHVPFDPQSNAYLGQYGAFDWLRAFLGDMLFRIGVPCLSAISGLLMFRRGLDGFDYKKVLRSKSSSVLLPFLLWNSIVFLYVLTTQSMGYGEGYFPSVLTASYRELVTLALATEDWPINLPLYFLRDLLLCFLLSPLIGFLVKRQPALTLGVLLLYVILPVPNMIFLKKSIILGFSAGAAIAIHNVDIRKLDRYALPIVAAVLISAMAVFVCMFRTGFNEHPLWLDVIYGLITVIGGLGAWEMTRLLKNTRLGKTLVAAPGGLSFWIFCAHYPILMTAWMVWQKFDIGPYPLFYVLALPVTFCLLLTSHFLAIRLTPGFYGVMTGQRNASGRDKNKNAAAGRALAFSKGD